MHNSQENVALGVDVGFPLVFFVSNTSFSSRTWRRSCLGTELFIASDSCTEVNNSLNLRDKEVSAKSRSRNDKVLCFVIDFLARKTSDSFPHQHKWVMPEFCSRATTGRGAAHCMVPI